MPAVVQSTTHSRTTTTGVLNLTFGSGTTAGSTVVAIVGAYNGTGDNTINSATLGGSADNFASVSDSTEYSNHEGLFTWADVDCAGGQTAVDVSVSSGGGGTYALAGVAYEISGLSGSPFDVEVTASLLDETWSIDGVPTAQASEIWLAAICLFASSADDAAITPPGSPWTNTAQLNSGGEVSLTAGYQIASAIATPAYAGTYTNSSGGTNAFGVMLTLEGVTASVTGTGGVLMPPGTLEGAGGSLQPVTASGGAVMPPRVIASAAKDSYPLAGGVLLPARSLAGSGVINKGIVMPPKTLAGSGYISPVGGGGVIMPARALAAGGNWLIPGRGTPVMPPRSLAGTGVTGDLAAGGVRAPSMTLGGGGTVAQQARGGMRAPAMAVAGTGTAGYTGHGGVRARKPTLGGTVGLQPQGSGGVTMPRMSFAGAGAHTRTWIWYAPDRLDRGGGVMGA